MPSRNGGQDDANDRRSSFQQRHQKGAANTGSNKARTPATNRKPSPQDDDDVWDEIMNADTSRKGGYDSDGPSKMSLNFWLQSGESTEIAFLDDKPVVFQGHTIKCTSPNTGKPFYRTEACGKAHGEECEWCNQSAGNKNISKPKRVLMFRIVDGRGQWDKDANDFDGVPALKFFQTSTELAQQIGVFKNDDNIGGITEVGFVLVKNEKYAITPKMRKDKKTGQLYFDDPIETEDDLVEVEDIYYPMDEQEVLDFIDQFVPAYVAPAPNSRHAGRGNGGGSFYGNNNNGNNRRGGSNSAKRGGRR